MKSTRKPSRNKTSCYLTLMVFAGWIRLMKWQGIRRIAIIAAKESTSEATIPHQEISTGTWSMK